MYATLNYKATDEGGGSYSYDVYYSVESGQWNVNFSGSLSIPPSFRNELGVTSAFWSCGNTDAVILDVAKTDVSDTYYHAKYTAASGAITATEHNISTTITALS